MKTLSEFYKNPFYFSNLCAFFNNFSTIFSIPQENVQLIIEGSGSCVIKVNGDNSTLQRLADKLSPEMFSFYRLEEALIISAVNTSVLLTESTSIHDIPRNSLFFSKDQSLKTNFIKTYQEELKGIKHPLHMAEAKNIMIAKFAGLAIICEIEKKMLAGELKLSYLGRTGTHLHPDHRNLFPSIKLSKAGISRLHFAVVENEKGDRVLIDLGSRYGTFVTFDHTVDKKMFDDSVQWITEIISNAQDLFKTENQEFQEISSNYHEVRDEIVKYLYATAKPLTPPLPNVREALFTNSIAIGWFPIPKGSSYSLIIGDHIMDIHERSEEFLHLPIQT